MRTTAHGTIRTTAMLAIAVGLTLAAGSASAARKEKACTQTAKALFSACKAEVVDDGFVKKAICINVSEEAERDQCFAELKEERAEAKELCEAQRDTRLEACTVLGEARYDPSFDPALFDDPKNPTNPNPYFPLTVGNRWEYR